ncbi:AAA family ATPase [Streptosporangium sp. NPDC051023]|uniref:AAA family ATPase n=1 Tax=Streptosporangium sp. NPDC051023 TaxID=3155410 RepID=UPI00344B7A55
MNVVYPERNPFPPQGTASMEERVLDDGTGAPTASLPSVERLWSVAERYLSGFEPGTRGRGQVVFLHGDHGSGKTHAIRFLLRRLAENPGETPYRFYVKLQDGDFPSGYRRLMSQIDRPMLRELSLRFLGTIAGAETGRVYGEQAGAVAASVLRADPDRFYSMLRDLQVELGSVLQAQARELAQIAGAQEDFQRALTSLLDPVLEEAAYDWLAGREIGAVDARRLGVSGPIIDPELCRYGIQLLVALCTRGGRPAVVILDQCERLVLGENGHVRSGNEGLLQSLVERLPQENGMLVLAGNEQVWERLPRDLKQRFGGNVVGSSAVTLEQTTELLSAYLRAVSPADDTVHPFLVSGVRALHTLGGGNARRILQLSWLAFELAAPDRALISRATVERALRGGEPSRIADTERPGFGHALPDVLAELGEGARLAVVEVAVDGITGYELLRDEAGTPHCRRSPVVRWNELAGEDPDGAAVRAAGLPAGADALFVSSFPGDPAADRALEALRAERSEAPWFAEPGVLVDALVRQAVLAEPLRWPYELVVLRADAPGGSPELAGIPLFAAGTRRGALASATVYCPPSDGQGTVFALVAWREAAGPRLVTARSAKLPPGRYEITAELERAGRVRLTGVTGLSEEERTWQEIVALVPARLDSVWEPVHVICAIEAGGELERVVRLYRIRQVLTILAEGTLGQIEVSLIVYGGHSYSRHTPDAPVDVVAWRVLPESALRSLGELVHRKPLESGIPDAAQVEDMLAAVVQRLRAADTERTVLLTVGDRPPHPPRVHASHTLPCPRRHDWEALLGELGRRPGLTLGAICDRPVEQADPVWFRLGGGRAFAHLEDMDVRQFLAGLGLDVSAQRIPFPIVSEVPRAT